MAKLSDLMPALSKVTGMPVTSVEAYARRIRQAGKLSSGGRGLGAADMAPKDCANLLIAVMARTPTHAVDALKRIGSMTSRDDEPGDRGKPLYEAFGLKPGHTFAESITNLVRAAQVSEIDKHLEKAFVDSKLIPSNNDEEYYFTMDISIITPWNSASIVAHAYDSMTAAGPIELWDIYLPSKYWRSIGKSTTIGPLGDTSRGDLHQETKITHKTIDALGQLLRNV